MTLKTAFDVRAVLSRYSGSGRGVSLKDLASFGTLYDALCYCCTESKTGEYEQLIIDGPAFSAVFTDKSRFGMF